MSLSKTLDPAVCNVQVTPGAVVCIECDYVGNITIGARTVIHPKARLLAENGPIVIGDGNLIEEQVEIVNRLPKDSNGQPTTVVIGSCNVFEVGSSCHSAKIGDNNVLEAKSFVGQGVELTKGCVVGALCRVACPQVVPENTVIYGSQHHRRTQTDKPIAQALQLEFLTKILPNYHNLVKPKKKPAT